MKNYIVMLFLITGIASPFLTAQQRAQKRTEDSSEKHYKKAELPSKGWVYEIDGRPIWAIVTKDNGETLSYIDKKGNKKNIAYDKIEKVKKGGGQVTHTKKGNFFYDQGLFFTLFTSVNVAGQESFTATAQGIIGYKLNKRLALGVGLGLDGYEDDFGLNQFGWVQNNQQFFFISPFVYGRYNLINKGPKVYAFSRFGFGKGIDANPFATEFSDGINFHPGIGVLFASRNIMKINIEFGMAAQRVHGEFFVRDQLSNQEILSQFTNTMIRPQLKLGIQFH